MNAPARTPSPPSMRGRMIAKVKIAQKDLQLDDAAYRAMLQRLTGQTSAATCSEAQLARVLEEFKSKGWRPKVVAGGKAALTAPKEASKRRPADHASAKKARALWISLHQLGVVRDPSETALEAFAKRQLKVDALQWADQGQTYKLIEALKAMAQRGGWDQDVSLDRLNTRTVDPVRVLKQRLVLAQWACLARLGAVKNAGSPPVCGLAEWARGRGIIPALAPIDRWPEPALEQASQRLGVWIHAADRQPAGDA